jgi:hypothetical protein
MHPFMALSLTHVISLLSAMELASLILGRKGSSCVLRLVKCNGGGEEYVTLERFESSSEEMRDSSKGKKTGSRSQSSSRTPTASTSTHLEPTSRAQSLGGGSGTKGHGKREGGMAATKSPRGGAGGVAIHAAKNSSTMGIVEPSSSRDSWQSDVTGLWGREMARER